MKPDAYNRNIAARAFDVARYLLFWGVPTNVGQVTSIRTLEKQIKRLRVSEFAEVRDLGDEIAQACAEPPECLWTDQEREPLAPTLARHAEPDEFLRQSRSDLTLWAAQNLQVGSYEPPRVDLIKPDDVSAEIAATLLYPVCDHPFRAIYETVRGWSAARKSEVIDVALKSRGSRTTCSRGFRGGQYCFDMLIDIGAYRDMHRHRRCHQYRQAYSGQHGYDIPELLRHSGAEAAYCAAMDAALAAMRDAARSGATVSVAIRRALALSVQDGLRGGGIHFARPQRREGPLQLSRNRLGDEAARQEIEPDLARLIDATPPWIEDPLKR